VSAEVHCTARATDVDCQFSLKFVHIVDVARVQKIVKGDVIHPGLSGMMQQAPADMQHHEPLFK